MIEQTWELIKHDAETNYLAWCSVVLAAWMTWRMNR